MKNIQIKNISLFDKKKKHYKIAQFKTQQKQNNTSYKIRYKVRKN